MIYVKALHIVFMVTWFAGLFYLPRLFVYHAMAEDEISRERFKIMERKLYFGIMTPGAILTFAFGLWGTKIWTALGGVAVRSTDFGTNVPCLRPFVLQFANRPQQEEMIRCPSTA